MLHPEEAYGKISELLDGLSMNRPVGLLQVEEFPKEMRKLAEKMNGLADELGKTTGFARELSRGNLDSEVPGRRTYIAAPLKELHSQLVSLSYSMQQLLRGNMVSKLYYPGDLYYWYNKIVEREMQRLDSLEAENWDSGNSWRYHQVLSAINQLHIMVIEVDEDGKIVFANPPARELFEDERLPYGAPAGEIKSELTAYLVGFEGRVDQGVSQNTVTAGFPVFHELLDNTVGAWYKITSDIIHMVDGSYGILHMIDDISEWKNQEQELTITASTDPLTGAYTRMVGMQKLREVVKLREVQQSCVAFVDIDNLKDINDRFGHAEGDFAIVSVADVLLRYTREEDWVIRYGGDEFVIVFRHCCEETAKKIVGRMEEGLSEVNNTSGKPYIISFSVGLAEIEAHMESVNEIISLIDRRMYHNKNEKKRLTPDAGDAII